MTDKTSPPGAADLIALAEEHGASVFGGSISFSRRELAAFVAALSAPAVVAVMEAPKGWKLVPAEPTPEMLDAAARASMQHLLDCIHDPKKAKELGSEENVRKTHASRYRSMLAASPPASPAEQAATQAEAMEPALEPVDGDLLPQIGEQVLIHLARQDKWVTHTVVGYYVWGDLDGDKWLQRVFVRVRDSQGYLNARILCDVRRPSGSPFVKEAAPTAPTGAQAEPKSFKALYDKLEGTPEYEAIRQEVAEQAAPKAEPVAWISHRACMPPVVDFAATPGALHVTPLYAAPYAVQPSGYRCAICEAALRPGFTCDVCGSDEAESSGERATPSTDSGRATGEADILAGLRRIAKYADEDGTTAIHIEFLDRVIEALATGAESTPPTGVEGVSDEQIAYTAARLGLCPPHVSYGKARDFARAVLALAAQPVAGNQGDSNG